MKSVELKTLNGDTYTVDYRKTKMFCPHCGKQSVWEEAGGGDYYIGVKSICSACGGSSYLDHGDPDPDEEVMNQLRQATLMEQTDAKS